VTLSTLSRAGARGELAARMVRYLLDARTSGGRNLGRWGNTNENATVLDALVSYYRAFEATPPDFRARVSLPPRPEISATFRGRSTEAVSRSVSMSDLARLAKESIDVEFSREGVGTLFYGARLQYHVPPTPDIGEVDQGIAVGRSYAVAGDEGTETPATAFSAGDLIRVTLELRLTKERRFVGVIDPLPAGFEPLDAAFATTARTLAESAATSEGPALPWLRAGGFDHVERHDDRVVLAATMLGAGTHRFSYLVRATRPGSFVAGPARAEEMYTPEVFGRSRALTVDVRP
jgi:hypothetical protein